MEILLALRRLRPARKTCIYLVVDSTVVMHNINWGIKLSFNK